MNIANGTAAAISLQSLPKKADGKGKTEAFLGKVIAKSGKEIQVLINDKVYKIEPGSVENIKIGDKIQVFFGKNLPQDISEEMLKKISGKLIDVFSLSLPYKTTKELENLINQMPQNERFQFAKISNEIVQMIESIIKESYSLQADKTSKQNSLNLFDPNLPYNRRLLELSLKAKEMGKAWDQIPDNIKKEIIKKYVLFDFPKQKGSNQNQVYDNKDNFILREKEVNHEKSSVPTSRKEQLINFEKETSSDGMTNKSNKDFLQEDLIKTQQNVESQNKKSTPNSTSLETSNLKDDNPAESTKKTVPLQQKQHSTYFLGTNINGEKKEIDVNNFEQETSMKKGANNQFKGFSNLNVKKITSEQVSSSAQSTTKNEKNAETTINKPEFTNNAKELTDVNQNKMTKILHQTEKENNNDSLFSKKEVKLMTEILENTISKPLALEKNINNINQIMNVSHNEKLNLESLENLIKQANISRESVDILQLIKRISIVSDLSDSSPTESLTGIKNNILEFLSSDTFEKMTQSPLLNLEIKNMITSLKDFGISQREASNTTLDIVNLATRAIKEENISQQLYSMSLKKYLKIKLPHLIIDNNIDQNKESSLMQKIEVFSKKAFVLVRAYAERLMSNKEAKTNQQTESSSFKNNFSENSTDSKNKTNNENNLKSKIGFTRTTSNDIQTQPQSKEASEKNQIKGENQNEPLIRNQSPRKSNEIPIDRSNDKQAPVPSEKTPANESEKISKNGNIVQNDSKFGETIQKNDFYSEKFIKFLNISSEKNDLSNPYSALITLHEQPFVIDFHHQKTDKGGYEKNEMYRVFIETNTQLFGSVFIDTVVSNKNIDIYIYAEEQYAKEFTNHSSTLIKRIKETDYDLRGLFIKEKLDQNGILKLKIKQYANPKNDGGFYSFA